MGLSETNIDMVFEAIPQFGFLGGPGGDGGGRGGKGAYLHLFSVMLLLHNGVLPFLQFVICVLVFSP